MPGIGDWKMEDLEGPDWIQPLPAETALLEYRLKHGQIDPKMSRVNQLKEIRRQMESADETARDVMLRGGTRGDAERMRTKVLYGLE